jgi:predicted  nucleic acid-binding Zn-ribbon protein
MLGRLFSKEVAAQVATINRLRDEADAAETAYWAVYQERCNLRDEIASEKDKAATAESAMQKMQRALSPEDPRAMAAEAAKQIADIYAQSFVSVAERDKAVAIVVKGTIKTALTGVN